MPGPVERAIRAKIASGTTLTTFAQSKQFIVDAIDREGIVLLLGAGRWRIRLTWSCLEGVPAFLGEGWVSLGGSHSQQVTPGTLDEYFKPHIKTDVARYLAAVLAQAGALDVRHGRPTQVRLRPGF